MNRKDSASLGGDSASNRGGIHQRGLGIDIYQHRARAAHCNSKSGGNEGHCWHDDLIPLADIESNERKMQCIGSGTAADSMFDATVVGERPLEHLRKLDLPVERRQRRIGVAALLQPDAIIVDRPFHDGIRELGSFPLAVLRLFRLEERRDREIAYDTNPGQFELRLVPEVPQLPVGHLVCRGADPLSQRDDLVHGFAQPEPLERGRLRRVPVERLDLPARQPDKRVAVPQGVRMRLQFGEGSGYRGELVREVAVESNGS